MQLTKGKMEYTAADPTYHMLVYIYGEKGSEPYGEIANFYLKETETFQNIGEMVLGLDEMCSRLGTAASGNGARLTYPESSHASNAKELLTVDIRKRQESGMQGKIRGKLTKWKYLWFDSELELMRVFYEMITDGGE